MATCRLGHGLVKFSSKRLVSEKDAYKSGYMCDQCEQKYKGSSYHCSQCEYDLCFKCHRKNEIFYTTANDLLDTETRMKFLSMVQTLQSMCF